VEGYRFRGHEAGTVTTRYGAFADLNWQVSRRWILGTRYDYVEAPRGPRTTEWQLSPTIMWWESEFVYLRLEGQHHHDELAGNDNRLLLQVVFAMGPHKHETY
jgi:outer membrane receptor protein involved in Fe transport